MPVPFETAALTGVGSCGCHQQMLAALASGNFTNIATNNAADGVYTLNGSAATIGDIIDLDNENAVFNPATNVDAGGIKAIDNGNGTAGGIQFEIQPSLCAALIASGFTLVIEYYAGSYDTEAFNYPDVSMNVHDADFLLVVGANASDTATPPARTGLTADEGNEFLAWSDNPTWTDGTALQINRASMSFTDTYCSMSINGDDAHRLTATTLESAMDGIAFFIGPNLDTRLRSFAFYEVVDDADLPALSAL